MRQADNDICFLVGNNEILSRMPMINSRRIFSDAIIDFLEELSKRLLRDHSLRQYSDLISFAFWIRQRNLKKLGKKYKSEKLRMGRGVAFHITPANIPIQFAVSLVYGLLSGNINVIRISDREFEEVNIICRTINEILKEDGFSYLNAYICIIRYGHNDEVNRLLSNMCDARIIWGGNNTISSLRKFFIPPRAIELCFADRDSICVIDSDQYMQADHKILARDFYNDTYYVDQNACSSPHIVIWLGDRKEEAKDLFWNKLNEELSDYDLPLVAGSEKLLKFCILAAKERNIEFITNGMRLVRVKIDCIWEDLLDYKAGMGYFFEYDADDFDEIIPLLRKSCQTVSYYGLNPESIKNLVEKYGVRGVDRIVPIGHTQELSLEWDGIDVVESLSRIVCSC